jgi:putative ABC transport system permease protein
MVAVSKLQRKLFRDLLEGKAQFGAVVIIIIFGITTFVATYESYQNLYLSYEDTYQRLSMADYWITVDYLPERAIREIDQIQGIDARGRIIRDIAIDLELESGQRVEGRVVSMPTEEHPGINDVIVTSGTYFSPGGRREILVENSFAEFHQLELGEWLTLEREGRKIPMRVMGTVSSPEYLWVAKSFQEPAAMPSTFGILFIPQTMAEEIFVMDGMVNEINLLGDENTDWEETLGQVRKVLNRYGIKRASSQNEPVPLDIRKIDIIQGVRTAFMVEREYQPSHHILKQDLDGFKQMSVLFPMLFLTLAAMAIYVLLNRLIESQRTQIGLMRALGYGKSRVLWHYISFALVIGLLGSIIGAILGHVLSGVFTGFYIGFLKIPYTVTQTQWTSVLIGIAIGVIIPLLAGVISAGSASRLRPAEAMRPPAPHAAHRTLLEILFPFMTKLPSLLKIPLRNAFRNPRRSLFMATGAMSATAMILVSMSFVDMMDWVWTTQFDRIQKYDARVIFQGIGSEATVHHIEQFQGVERAEAILEQPYRMKLGEEVQDSAIRGMEPGSIMYNLLDPDGNLIAVTDDGLLLPLPLRDQLGAQTGDLLYLEPIIGTVGETQIRVTGIVMEPMGGRAYLSLDDAQELLQLPGGATGALVNFAGNPSPELLKRIYKLPQVMSVEFASGLMEYFDEMMSFFWAFIGVMLAMSFGLGIAIVFNGVTVNVLERRREIAIMRAVGMNNRQLTVIITLENLFIAGLGLALGLPGGYYIAHYFMEQASTEMMSMPAVIYPRSFVIATIGTIIILLVSQLPAIRKVTTMSLPTVTKDWSE